jgi:hypothetical protein
LRGKQNIGLRAGKVLNRYKMGLCAGIRRPTRKTSFLREEVSIAWEGEGIRLDKGSGMAGIPGLSDGD